MTKSRDAVGDSVIAAWRTNCRITAYLVDHVPPELWTVEIPPRRTVRMMLAHFHNSRVRWLKTLGREHGIRVPALVDLRRVTRPQLLRALQQSAEGMEALLRLGVASGGQVPPSKGYVWRNLPLDVGHVLAYFVAHEGHHRGQIVMLARQTGHRLPRDVVNGLWQFTQHSKRA